MEILNMFSVAMMCMSLNIYHEARNEPIEGQYAVAFVTMNRAKNYRQNVCEVVYKKSQFSWTNTAFNKDGSFKKSYLPRSGKHWNTAQKIALEVLQGRKKDFTRNATYFYADYIRPPKWSASKEHVGKWGVHIFLREHKIARYKKNKAAPITLAAASASHHNQLGKVAYALPAAYSDQGLKQSLFQHMQFLHQYVGLTKLAYSQQIPASLSLNARQHLQDSSYSSLFLCPLDQYQSSALRLGSTLVQEDYFVRPHLLI